MRKSTEPISQSTSFTRGVSGGRRSSPVDDATQIAAAPSVSGEELPAVSVPLPLVRSNDGGRRASFSSDVSVRGMVSRLTSPNGITRSSKKPLSQPATAPWWALQGDLVLLLAADLPFLGGDFGMLAHAEARRAIGDRRDVEPDVLELDVRDMVELLAERAGLLELAQPVRQPLSQPDLHAAQAVDAAHQGEIVGIAVDHAGRFDRAHHAGRACHDGREGRDRGVDAGIHGKSELGTQRTC